MTLQVAEHFKGSEFYLFRKCGDGQIAHTHHKSLDEAIDLAEWEFGVKAEEWEDAK